MRAFEWALKEDLMEWLMGEGEGVPKRVTVRDLLWSLPKVYDQTGRKDSATE